MTIEKFMFCPKIIEEQSLVLAIQLLKLQRVPDDITKIQLLGIEVFCAWIENSHFMVFPG